MAITLQAGLAGQVILTIRDTGIGLPADLDVHHAESFGLHLVNMLTEQLHATITLAHDGGTCVTLTFPV